MEQWEKHKVLTELEPGQTHSSVALSKLSGAVSPLEGEAVKIKPPVIQKCLGKNDNCCYFSDSLT